MTYERIEMDPEIMGGKTRDQGHTDSGGMILRKLGAGIAPGGYFGGTSRLEH